MKYVVYDFLQVAGGAERVTLALAMLPMLMDMITNDGTRMQGWLC